MKGVKFGGLHSFYEWGLILSEKEIKAPKPKKIEFEIEGSDGVLDYTDFFGGVKFENRQLTFRFTKAGISPDGFLTLFSAVQNALHGKKLQVILDDDPMHFYFGRVTINEWKSNKRIGEIVIEVDAEPYKYKVARSREVVKFYGKNILNLENTEQGVLNATVGMTFTQLTAYSTTTRLRSKVPFYIKPNTQYTFTVPSEFKAAVRQFDENNVLVASSAWVTSPYTFRTHAKAETLAVYIAFAVDGTIVQSDVSGKAFQLEEGGTATAFEAYDLTEQTASAFLENSKMPSVPDIYSQDDVTITNGEETVFIRAGETLHREEFQLKEGSNQFNITGTGIVVFDWQEGGM